jgi:GNAT superfamily N-acetyltransferase
VTITVRRARADEAATLTGLVLRAKASWGYDTEFMAARRDELTMTPQKLAEWVVWAAEIDGTLAGMIALGPGDPAEVEEFFVEPAFQRRGVGSALMAELVAAARAAGAQTLEVDADPYAEVIYERLGFETFGRTASGAGRWLPRMRMTL